MPARGLKMWAFVGLVAAAHLFAAPHASGFVKHGFGLSVAGHAARATQTLVRPLHGTKVQTQGVEARRVDPVAPAPVVAAATPQAPRPSVALLAGAARSIVPAPVALLHLAPRLPPPARSIRS